MDCVLLLKENLDKNFKVVYEEYHHKVYYFLLSKGFNEYESQDLVQEIFIKLYQYAHRLNPEIKFSTQIFQIAKSVYVSYLRKKKNEFVELSDNVTFNLKDEPENLEYKESIYSKLQQAIEKLPSRCKQILLLRNVEKWSYMQIALYLSISKKTVENQLNKAVKKLKKEDLL